ncbi:hypothetical protein Q1695_012522 [Nippostrongylus brasiliensis]|nr:hypothetical protein Q1695_012522 [Nippostrongylus brasiliensis]
MDISEFRTLIGALRCAIRQFLPSLITPALEKGAASYVTHNEHSASRRTGQLSDLVYKSANYYAMRMDLMERKCAGGGIHCNFER